jgi:hypothetical protein
MLQLDLLALNYNLQSTLTPKIPISQFSFGAGEGNRTPVVSLEGFCSTIELHPHIRVINYVDSRLSTPS